MILLDTSVWIDHFRHGNRVVMRLLAQDHVFMHPYIVGELACGSLRKRQETLSALQELSQLAVVPDSDVLFFLERQKLFGKGLGYVDLHLLAATVMHHAQLWTMDKILHRCAAELHVQWSPG